MKVKDIFKIFISTLSFFIIGIVILLIIANSINPYEYFNIFIVDFCKITLGGLIGYLIFRIEYGKRTEKHNYKNYKNYLVLRIIFTLFLTAIFIYNSKNSIGFYSLMDYKEFYLNSISVIRGSLTLVFILSILITYLILEYIHYKKITR